MHDHAAPVATFQTFAQNVHTGAQWSAQLSVNSYLPLSSA